MSERFPQYTTDYISGVMSLRKPQTASLKILEDILNSFSASVQWRCSYQSLLKSEQSFFTFVE